MSTRLPRPVAKEKAGGMHRPWDYLPDALSRALPPLCRSSPKPLTVWHPVRVHMQARITATAAAIFRFIVLSFPGACETHTSFSSYLTHNAIPTDTTFFIITKIILTVKLKLRLINNLIRMGHCKELLSGGRIEEK
ncbi:hypothetical protein [Geomonas anaerohicana]